MGGFYLRNNHIEYVDDLNNNNTQIRSKINNQKITVSRTAEIMIINAMTIFFLKFSFFLSHVSILTYKSRPRLVYLSYLN
jgi:hypothetical protein